MERIKTSISVDPAVWKEFKKKCIDVGKNYSEVLENLMAGFSKK